jgi:hypothetical protein
MIGLGHQNPVGTFLTDGLVAQNDFFDDSIIKDSLERLYISIHPGSVDPANRSTWFDLSNNLSNASLFNSPVITDNGFVFNGTNQFSTYVWPFATTNNSSLNFSIEFWVKPNAISDLYVVGNNNPGAYIRMLYTVNGRYILFFVVTASGLMQLTTAFVPYTIGEVEHIVCVRNNDRLFVYRNGILQNLQSQSGFFNTPVTIPINFIGRYVSSYYAGIFYYYALYSKSLNAEEVNYNYQKNKDKFV